MLIVGLLALWTLVSILAWTLCVVAARASRRSARPVAWSEDESLTDASAGRFGHGLPAA